MNSEQILHGAGAPAHTGVRTADSADIPALVRLRLAYLADEHGIPESALDPRIAGQLPRYFAAHLNRDCVAALYEALAARGRWRVPVRAAVRRTAGDKGNARKPVRPDGERRHRLQRVHCAGVPETGHRLGNDPAADGNGGAAAP